jgi:hypothetical protein
MTVLSHELRTYKNINSDTFTRTPPYTKSLFCVCVCGGGGRKFVRVYVVIIIIASPSSSSNIRGLSPCSVGVTSCETTLSSDMFPVYINQAVY